MTDTAPPALGSLDGLKDALAGSVLLPGDSAYDDERNGFDLSVDQRPALVVQAASAADIQTAVRFARSRHLAVGLQATGHGLTTGATGGLLIATRSCNTVSVDAPARTARVSAGATWDQVLKETTPHELAPLCGSAPGVGAVSYTLGGGLGPLGRRYGFAADRVLGLEVIGADGEARRVTASTEPDLFWALRGGGGSSAAVTDLHIELMPVAQLYGGGLFFPGAAADDVVPAFLDACAQAPDELTLSVALITFPNAPQVDPAVRGSYICHVRVAFCGPATQGEDLIAGLRGSAQLVLDTVRTMPFRDVGSIHADPTTPRVVEGRTVVLRDADEQTIEVLLSHAGPSAAYFIELRHLGGALGRAADPPNAVGHRDGRFNVYTSAYPSPDLAAAGAAEQHLMDDLEPWSDGGALVNFLAGPWVTTADLEAAYDDSTWARLREIKAHWDPDDMFRFNHSIPAGGPR